MQSLMDSRHWMALSLALGVLATGFGTAVGAFLLPPGARAEIPWATTFVGTAVLCMVGTVGASALVRSMTGRYKTA